MADFEIETKELVFCKCCSRQLRGSELASGNVERVCDACRYYDKNH